MNRAERNVTPSRLSFLFDFTCQRINLRHPTHELVARDRRSPCITQAKDLLALSFFFGKLCIVLVLEVMPCQRTMRKESSMSSYQTNCAAFLPSPTAVSENVKRNPRSISVTVNGFSTESPDIKLCLSLPSAFRRTVCPGKQLRLNSGDDR